MSQISMYLNWLYREQANQLVNVAFLEHGKKDELPGHTIPMTEDAIAELVAFIEANKPSQRYDAIWTSVHAIKSTTDDRAKVAKTDIDAYRYLAIDVDSILAHKLKASATDEERARTLATATDIANMLVQHGLPQPLKIMSGNGNLLLFPIDLPYNKENHKDDAKDPNYAMMEEFADMLADIFDSDDCEVDTAVIKDPSRLLGLVGTENRSKAEIPSEGRFAKERTVIGDYPPHEPMTAEAFTIAVKAMLAEHEAKNNIMDDHADGVDGVDGVDGCDGKVKVADDDEQTVVWDSLESISMDDRVSRCKKYLDKCDDSRSGQKGHDAAFHAACECYRFGLSEIEAKKMVDWFNSTKCTPPWTPKELEHKLADANRKVSAKGDIGCRLDPSKSSKSNEQSESGESGESGEPYPLTELGNAEHFRDTYGDDLRYVVAWKSWLIWNGKNWSRDCTDKVRRFAMKHVRQNMPKYASQIKDDDRRSKYLKWASQSQSEAKVDSMLSLSSSLLACSPNDFDANPNLFNVENGTLELDTQNFRPHDKKDLLIKIASVRYDPKAPASKWEKFINRIFQDANGNPRVEVVEYVQRAVGYSMTADVTAQCLFVLNGSGKNGKTTFVNAIKNVMGDYAKNGMQSLLLKLGDRNANRNTDDEADLHGLRLVAVSETDEGMRFDASKVKRLVDTDHIRAMRKFEHSFEFKPSHKLWLCCNRMPKVDGNDDAMKRRLKKIPFLVQVPPDERDEDLGDKLQLESSGVLNWMLKGLAAWFADGRRLNEPKEIQDAVGEYFHDHDSFGSFLCDEIENNCAAKTAGSSVYAAYNLWANANGMDFKLTKIEFGRRMAERGYRSIPYHGVRHFVGCSLLRGDRFQYQPSVETVKDDGPKF